MSRKLVAWVFVWLLLCVLGSSVASAREPEAVFWRVVDAVREGSFQPGLTPNGDTQVLVELFPSDDQFRQQHLLVVFPGCGEDPSSPNRPVLNLEEVLRRGAPARYAEWEDPGPRWRVCPADSAYLLDAGQARQLSLSVDFLRAVGEGVSPRLVGEVHILSDDDMAKIDPQKDVGCQWASIVGRRAPAAQLTIDLYYRLSDKGTFVLGEYGDVFGRPGPDPVKDARMTGDYRQGAADLQVDLLSFHSSLRIPAQTRDDGGRLFRRTLEEVRRAGSALVGGPFCTSEDFKVGGRKRGHGGDDDDDDGHCGNGGYRCHGDVIDARPEPLPQAAGPLTNLATYHVSGRFSTKWSADHSLHPGFGFRVEAWTDDLFPGVFVRLASDWVQADGTWSLTLAPTLLFSGHRLRMLYVTSTDYYDAQDINGNHYAWRDPDWLNIPTTFDVGHRFADTDGGTFNGVGEMVDAAMYTWSRLYWNGGLNPVRSSPINLIAPNTGDACGTPPWSCANGGSIWLIAAHAAQAQVVSHELGHQLNFKFWNDKKPANNGGSHSLNSCYPSRLGMTLFEGFADFLAGWVGYPGRNVADGGFGSGRWTLGWDLEQRTTPPNCTNGWENETWVARTFWDLHDTHGDGNDVLWFNSLGAVPVLYLANGVANDGDARDMRDYRTVYQNAASPGHQTYISDIFDQNRQ
jgi:hypothetical protein